MPTYEFACRECGIEFEVEVPHIGDRPSGCPHCKSAELDRLLSPVNAVTSSSSQAEARPACGTPDACAGCPCAGPDFN